MKHTSAPPRSPPLGLCYPISKTIGDMAQKSFKNFFRNGDLEKISTPCRNSLNGKRKTRISVDATCVFTPKKKNDFRL